MPFLAKAQLNELKEQTAPDKRYMGLSKLPQDEAVRIRFLGSAITGYEGWTTQKKPMRWEVAPEDLPANLATDDSGNPQIRYFVAGIVWDYSLKKFRVLQINQRTILEQIYKYEMDEDYGDVTGYDVIITRSGEGLNTKYSVLAKPPKPMAATIKAEFEELGWDLQRLYDGKHPWPDKDPTKEESDDDYTDAEDD
jgi:hypothetical protein